MRTFSEQEARDVFARAARDQQAAQTAVDPSAGLTLDELQEIGRASGLDPAFVAAAARAVAVGVPESRREAWMGIPTGVSHTAFLPEPPSDDLWEPLVGDARRLFDARGRAETMGRLREWRNGNLVVVLEPSGDGSRLHVRTRRADGVVYALAAATFGVLALGLVAAAMLSGGGLDGGALVAAAIVAALAAALGGNAVAGQRRWSARREAQMAQVAERALARTRAQTTDAATDEATDAAVETPSHTARGPSDPASLGDVLDALGDDPLGDALGGDAAPRRRARS